MLFGSHKGTKAKRGLLSTNNIRTPTAERTVVDNLRQMPPATTAFVVGGFHGGCFCTLMNGRDDEYFGKVNVARVTGITVLNLKTGADVLVATHGFN
jgi:hypothetical protein